MRRGPIVGVALHGALLTAALGVAYFDLVREKPKATQGDVEVWTVDPDDVTAVHLTAPNVQVELTLRTDDPGEQPYPWLRVERTTPAQPTPPPAPAGDPAAPAPETGDAATTAAPAPPPVVKTFLGSERTRERLGDLARLRADRALGVVGDETLAKLGLAPASGRLVVTARGRDLALDVGEKAVGDRLRYVRDPGSGTVYVIQDALVSDLEQADTRLLNRDLHAFADTELARATVRIGDTERTFVRVEKEAPARSFWAAAETPDAEDERVTAWFGKLGRLRVERYLAEGEDPLAEEARRQGKAPDAVAESAPGETLLVLELETETGAPGRLELLRFGAPGEQAVYVARTEHTRGDVVVNRFLTEEAVQDLGTLFGQPA